MKRRSERSPILTLVVAMLLGALAAPVSGVGTARADDFDDGRRLFEADRFEEAVVTLERAVEAQPDDSERHRWLGMAYGRLAEHGTWNVPRRLILVGQTRASLERAVELDPENLDALETLMDFYLEAPSFFGGDVEKAAALERRIEALERAAAGGGSEPAPKP